MGFGELTVWTEECGGTPIIGARGEIDLGTVGQLREVVAEVVRRKPGSVIFDLREVTYIDSTGLGILVATRKQLESKPDSVVIITEQPSVLQSLSLTGLDRVFRVVPRISSVRAETVL